MKEKFEIKSGMFIALHFRLGFPSHLTWGTKDSYMTRLPFENGSGWSKQEILTLDRIKNEDEFVRFMTLLASMHNLKAVRRDVAGDKRQEPNRCILIEFC